MKKGVTVFVCIVCLIMSTVILSACRNEGLFVDKSQPWYDDNGGYHDTSHCGNHATTSYTDILMDTSDERDSSSSSTYYYYTHTKHYHSYKKHNQVYMTIPVPTVEYTCVYS